MTAKAFEPEEELERPGAVVRLAVEEGMTAEQALEATGNPVTDETVEWLTRRIHDEQVGVTPQELAAQERLQWQVDEADAKLQMARQKMFDRFQNEQLVIHWDVESLWEAETTWMLWHQVQSMVQDPDDAMFQDTVGAVSAVVGAVKDELLRTRCSSRSTSTISNAEEDVRHDAKRNWLSSQMFVRTVGRF